MGVRKQPRYPKEIKDEIIDKIKNTGLEVKEAERIYGVPDKTIYKWISELKESTDPHVLEISRLRRENEELLQIIGELTLDLKKKKKLESLKRLSSQEKT